MPYVSTHFGVDVEFRPNMEAGKMVDIDISITPVTMGDVFQPVKIRAVYLNNNLVTAMEQLDTCHALGETK